MCSGADEFSDGLSNEKEANKVLVLTAAEDAAQRQAWPVNMKYGAREVREVVMYGALSTSACRTCQSMNNAMI